MSNDNSLDVLYDKAAQAIKKANFLLIGAGAGMSADAGLPVFAAINQQDIFQKLGLSYDQVCSPTTLVKDPALFYGFELGSLVKYKKTPPHEGYSILKSWHDQIIDRNKDVIEKLQSLQKSNSTQTHTSPTLPRNNFVVTSNVDGHFERVGFASSEVSQIHGTLHKFQCAGVPNTGKQSFLLFSRGPCCNDLWDAPTEDLFQIDESTMRCTFNDGNSYVKCKFCKDGVGKPNIYLFGDGKGFVEHPEIVKYHTYSTWKESVLQLLKENKDLRVVVIEIGSGLRVPSIRKRCEEFYGSCPSQCEFIRINPEFPDNKITHSPTIPIKETCLKALQQINARISVV